MTNENTRIVCDYLNAMFGGDNDFDGARERLADDLQYEGPMLVAADADDFVSQMRALGERFGAMTATVRAVLTTDDRVAAFYTLDGPTPVLFGELFRVRDGKIASIAIAHDTFSFRGAAR